MDNNREARPFRLSRTPSPNPEDNKSGNSIPASPKSENPIPASPKSENPIPTSESSSSSSPPHHKEFFPRLSNPQSSGSSRNNAQHGGFSPGSLLPHNAVRSTTTESVEEVQQNRFAFLLPPQRLTESTENLGANARRERRERRERINNRWNAASRESYNRDDRSIDAITEMLLAVERFEQEGHVNYQELIMRETNLLLGGLHFHDEHSDMRMDIDNMSYEELLALEETIGYVSTALPKHELAKCVQKSLYHPNFSQTTDKCSICQEEFEEGDEIGKLRCNHIYHVICVTQWLNTKNICPVCKTSLNSQ